MPQISPVKLNLVVIDNKVVVLDGRFVRFRRRKTPAKGLSSEQIYERKRQQRLERARILRESAELSNYIDWISNIQRKLGLSNTEFAEKLGISCQSVKLWKRRTGHFPSKRTLLRLLELDLEARIPIRVIRVRYGVRM